MTTLSKEDVVQALEALESMDDFARMDIGVDPIGPYRVLRKFIAARADIVEANKALVAENERLKAEMNLVELALPEDYSESKDWKFDKSPIARIEWLKIWHRYNKSRIADLEAFVDKQDAAISEKTDQLTATRTALAAAELREIKLREFVKNSTEYRCGHPLYEHALAQPRDDSALREMIAGVYEECAKVIWYDMTPKDIADAIRALAEKKLASLTS